MAGTNKGCYVLSFFVFNFHSVFISCLLDLVIVFQSYYIFSWEPLSYTSQWLCNVPFKEELLWVNDKSQWVNTFTVLKTL